MAEDPAHAVVTSDNHAVGNIDALAAGGGSRGHAELELGDGGGRDGYVEQDGHPLPSEETG